MRVRSNSFNDGESVPGEFAFAVVDPNSHVAPGGNRNPHLAWDNVPEEASAKTCGYGTGKRTV